jgi:hypothetical protein
VVVSESKSQRGVRPGARKASRPAALVKKSSKVSGPASVPSPVVKQVDSNRGPDGRFLPGAYQGGGWKPGQSGNPAGRPKSKTISEEMRELLAETDLDGQTVGRVVAAMIVGSAKKGSLEAARELLDRTEGKARQTVENIDGGFNPERWLRIAAVLGEALEPYPEAHKALCEALARIRAQDAANG